MTIPLNTNDLQLPLSVQTTLAVLLKNGIATAGRHDMTSQQVAIMKLSGDDFRELVSAGIAAVVTSPGGQVVRPMTSVATEVELFHNGDIGLTLAVDLI